MEEREMQRKKGKDTIENEIVRKNRKMKKEEEMEKTGSRFVRVEKRNKEKHRKNRKIRIT
jgi:hypothetical protein